MPRNACIRPILSDSHAQTIRPPPLNSASAATRPPAAVTDAPVTSRVASAAWEISAMPQVTFRARIAVSRYHWGVRRASPRLNTRVPATAEPVVAGVNPGTR
jgi:hypothetical protein